MEQEVLTYSQIYYRKNKEKYKLYYSNWKCKKENPDEYQNTKIKKTKRELKRINWERKERKWKEKADKFREQLKEQNMIPFNGV